jgi:hypothetical protein
MSTILWQRIEGGLVFLASLASVVASSAMGNGASWWLDLIIFFAPDLGFLGYLAGPKVGATVYNLLHLYGLGLALAVAGFAIFGSPLCTTIGLLWMAHVGFDRMLGYGLKEPTGFAETHLGRIGRK